MSEQLLTCREAAEVLGMSESGVYKLLSRGVLTRRHNARGDVDRGGIVDRAEVEQLAHDRRLAAAEADHRKSLSPTPVPDPWPDVVDGHAWLTATQAAKVIGISGQAVRKRCRKGTIPHARNAAGWWIREDHARLAAHARATTDDEDVADVRHQVLGAGTVPR